MGGFTLSQTPIAEGSEIKSIALSMLLGKNVVKVSLYKKVDPTFKRLHDHIVSRLLNIFARGSHISNDGIELNVKGGRPSRYFIISFSKGQNLNFSSFSLSRSESVSEEDGVPCD